MSQVSDFAAATQAAFAQVNASLDNIVADETNLNKMIQDLKDQLSKSGLSQADQDALSAVSSAAAAMVARSKSIADGVPDLPTPPIGV